VPLSEVAYLTGNPLKHPEPQIEQLPCRSPSRFRERGVFDGLLDAALIATV
jgi:hypothetical protein